MPDTDGAVRTVDDFLKVSDAKATSKRQYAMALASMERMIGTPLADASQRDVIALAGKLRAKTCGPQYAKIAKMFYRATDREDVAKLLKYLALEQRTKKIRPDDLLTPREVQAMIAAADNMRDRILVALLWETGVRVSELLAVDLRDVKEKVSPENHGRKMYVLWFGQVKETGQEHEGYVIEAAPLLEEWLKAYPFDKAADSPLVPSQRGNRFLRKDSLIVVQRLARKAGIKKHVYNHLFRHSRATWALASGMTDAQVKALYGWAPGSPMLARYSHLTSKQAYRGLLKAEGLEAETLEVERLRFDDTDLKPVVPIVADPGRESSADTERRMGRQLLDEIRDAFLRDHGELGVPTEGKHLEIRVQVVVVTDP